jgi:hypothetical protein
MMLMPPAVPVLPAIVYSPLVGSARVQQRREVCRVEAIVHIQAGRRRLHINLKLIVYHLVEGRRECAIRAAVSIVPLDRNGRACGRGLQVMAVTANDELVPMVTRSRSSAEEARLGYHLDRHTMVLRCHPGPVLGAI